MPGQQTFTHYLAPLRDRTFGIWGIRWVSNDVQLLLQVVDPTVARAEIRLDDGTVVEGTMVDMPPDMIGPARVFGCRLKERDDGRGSTL